MVRRLQNFFPSLRRDVITYPDGLGDHLVRNVETERTGLCWDTKVNDLQGECYGSIVSIRFFTLSHTRMIEEELNEMFPILREIEKPKKR